MLAFWYNVPPDAYYRYDLYRPERRKDALDYIHNPTLTSLAVTVNPKGNFSDFRDKVRFSRLCERNSLPTIPVLAVFQDGRIIDGQVTSADALPETDLFAKPTDAGYGTGALAWTFIAPDRYRSSNGTHCSRWDVFDALCQASRERAYMLQPRVANHPELAKLTDGGLCTLRVLTAQRRSGRILPVAAVFKMPRKGALADTFETGGIACPVGLADGRLGTAAGEELTVERFTHHPDTGQQIRGIVIPHWKQVRNLCISAHDRLSKLILIGWDVAVTDQGPLLVEGNYRPGMRLLQKGGDRPITKTPFVSVFLEHLERKPNPSAAVSHDAMR